MLRRRLSDQESRQILCSPLPFLLVLLYLVSLPLLGSLSKFIGCMNLILIAMDKISVVFLWFGLASVITEVLSRGGGGLLPEGKKIAVSMSISLIALAASASLPLRPLFITICRRLSICSSALTCAFLLSPFLPSKLFWVPYIACVFTLLHLLRLLLPDPLKRSLQRIWCDTWKETRGAASSAYDATVRSVKALLQSSRAATSNGAPETSTSPYSSSPSTAAALSIEEGNPDVIHSACINASES